MNTVSSQLEALVGSLQNSKQLDDGTVRALLTSLQSLLVTDDTSGDQKDRIAHLTYTVIVRYCMQNIPFSSRCEICYQPQLV